MRGIIDYGAILPAKRDLQSRQLELSQSIDRFQRANNPTVQRTYPQDWPSYNAAAMKEKIICEALLLELVDLLEDEERPSRGRPKVSNRDRLMAMFLSTFENLSSRRIISDIELSRRRFVIDKTPHFNTVLNFFNDKSLTPLLSQLVQLSSMPLSQVEMDFAADSSGFSTSMFERWVDIRTNKNTKKRIWKKCHLMCGVITNTITNVIITEGIAGDSPHLIPLIEKTRPLFNMRKILADKAYSSRANLEAISAAGAIGYIPFKKNARGLRKGSQAWRKMFEYFRDHEKEYMQHYHDRSNVETTFSMIKRKFSHKLKTRKYQSQVNEILMKCLCHNLGVLVHESFKMGLEIDFAACLQRYNAQKRA